MSIGEADAANEQPFAASEWAGDAGKRWVAGLDRLEKMIEPIGEALLTHAGYRPGERVVDIGCGGGWTTQQIAHAVGPDGYAAGLDISSDLVAVARERAEAAAVSNIWFEVGDAALHVPDEAPFDRLFSRFGSMFFAEPYPAFANLRRMLKEDGRLDIAVWAPANENPWFVAMMGVLMQHVELPPAVPRAPGPFALGEPDYIRDLLMSGGFAEPRIEAWNGTQYIGGPGNGAEEAAAFVLETMHVGDLAKSGRPETVAAVKRDLTSMFAGHETTNGVALPSKALFVTAAAQPAKEEA